MAYPANTDYEVTKCNHNSSSTFSLLSSYNPKIFTHVNVTLIPACFNYYLNKK